MHRRPWPASPEAPTLRRALALGIGSVVVMTSVGAEARRAVGANAPAGTSIGRIEKVVASGDRLAVLAGRAVGLFDADGRVLGRCGGFEAAPERPAHERVGALDSDEALAVAGLPDDDDSTDAEDALADEGLGQRQRRPSPTSAPPPLPHDLAVTPADDAVWVATSDGLFRESNGRCARAGLAGRDLILSSAGEGVVAVASETLLWRYDVATSSAYTAGGLPERPRALAVADGGRILVADDDGLLEVMPGSEPVRRLDRPTTAVAFCDGVLVALADDGVYVERGGALERAGDRPPVRGLACGSAAGPRFLGGGVGVWTSDDGATWTERPGALGRTVSAAAATADHIWMAADGELVVLDDDAPAPPQPAALQSAAGAMSLRARPPLSVPLPRVTVGLGTQQTQTRVGWSVVVLLTFPLGRRAARGPGPSELAAERLRRDAALAAEQFALASQASSDESVAIARALEQERTALR